MRNHRPALQRTGVPSRRPWVLGPLVQPAILSSVLQKVKKHMDIYAGIRTEQQELSKLGFHIPMLSWHERALVLHGADGLI